MLKITRRIAFCSLGLAFVLMNASAQAGPLGLARPLKKATESAFMQLGPRTLAPFAHVRFCVASPGECAQGSGPKSVDLTKQKLDLLRSVNARVNGSIEPFMPDGLETWQVNPDRGNCHDYAVTKRHELIRAGWPSSSLRLAIAYTSGGVGHLVVIVRTTEGDLVLDNLTNRIVNWRKSGLRFVSMDGGDEPRVWYAVR